MDSGNSGSISSSGDEEYDSRADHTVLPSPFLNQFGSISQPQSSLVSSHYHQTQHHPSLFDLSSSYLHALSQPQPNSSNPNSFLNLDTATSSQGRRSEPDCTDITGVSSSSSTPPTTTGGNSMNQCLLGPQVTDNARVVLSSSQGNNVVRNSKKRTRASRRAPTTVLTTDTSNFRAMVQEFTGIPAPPFSASSSYSRRLDLLTGSSSLRSSTSHLDTPTGTPFYPLRPSPQKLHHHHHHQNPLILSSSSSPSTLLHNNMVDAIASSTTTTNNSSSNNNSVNYQQLPPDLGLPYHNPQNIMLSMQNHPPLAFHPPPPPPPLHPFGNNLPTGFSAKLPSIEDLGMSHGQVNNANFVASGVSVPSGHAHVSSDGVTLRNVNDDGGGRRDVPLRSLDGGSCKLNFSAASASASLNHEKSNLENNNNNNINTTRGEGTVDSWICSSD
ncbi:type-2 histone deacetylase 1-like [Abrus precatorius]|uniref:Type-2 histone deacetylase 1-like n=1 Tax=Abrus precatorius TaxID=3816 RepID=A0A8B8JNK8_ABRPR|nr:type-2 histone deacetylase 1-like [Abrus precatorius]